MAKIRKVERLIKDIRVAFETPRRGSLDIENKDYSDILSAFFTAINKIAKDNKDTIVIAKLYLNMVIVFDSGKVSITMITDNKAAIYKKQISSSEMFSGLVSYLPKDFNVSIFLLEDIFEFTKKCLALNILCNPLTSLIIHADNNYVIRPFMYGGSIGIWRK